jgi:tetratricopeptide (TPR) repeat protein
VAEDFVVTHTFGVFPLQQYLVEFPGGRLQSLPFAWDSRAAADGGQQWFHVYGDQEIAPGDELHWTGRQQNWNYMCAECHSTNLQVNYDQRADTFATTWSEINVGCEGCHGPASIHVADARNSELRGSKGLQVDLDDHGRAAWIMNPETGIAERSELAMRRSQQPEACGRCHARRGLVSSDYEYDQLLADTHRPSLVSDPLYFDDGQIRDEVYVYGSFLQSRMYQAGVTCSDCHNPHSLQLITGAEPSDVCSQCHLPDKFAARDHHQHDPAEVACVDCHMPARDYMQVDPRRDHSFRIPRPDLSVATNAPNACANCHTEEDSTWAAAAALTWWGQPDSHFATSFAEARAGGGNLPLRGVATDQELPGIVRATAVAGLGSPASEDDARLIQESLADADPLVRMAAVGNLLLLPPETRVQLVAPVLKDSVRSVRIEAARIAAPLRDYLPLSAGFAAAAEEFRDAQLAIASRPEAHVALGDFESSLGNIDTALEHYAFALKMDPAYSFSRLNYADALRRSGDESGAESLLREGLDLNEHDADLTHSLGLLLVRTDRSAAGLVELQKAAALAPNNSRYAYVLAIALNSLGQADAAIATLREARVQFPGDFDIAWSLATLLRDSGNLAGARKVAEDLAAQRPDDANVRKLLESLSAA